MQSKYLVGALLATFVILINQTFIQYWLYQKNHDAKTINTSGRQRMLSQRIYLEFERAQRDKSYQLLEEVYREWAQAHQALLQGNQGLGITQVKTPQIRERLINLSPLITSIHTYIELKDGLSHKNLDEIYKKLQYFLSQMEIVVKELEEESQSKLTFIVITEIVLALLSILIILLDIIFIFQPISNSLKQKVDEIEQSEKIFRAIFNNAAAMKVIISNEANISYLNKLAQMNHLGLFRQKVTLGEDYLGALAPSYKEEFAQLYQKAITGRVVQIEKNFDRVNTITLIYPIFDDKLEEILGVAMIIQDISGLKSKELQFSKHIEMLNKIIWHQSHKVRRPIANILGITSFLMKFNEDEFTEETSLLLNYLHEEIHNLDDIVYKTITKSQDLKS